MNYVPVSILKYILCTKYQCTSTNNYLFYTCRNTGSKIIKLIQQI